VNDVPSWRLSGDWFDACKCLIPCSCTFAASLGDMLGMEVAETKVEIADDLSRWGAEIPGKAKAEVEPLSGPTSVEGKLTTVTDPPGAEVGPGAVATFGTATTDEADAFGLSWSRSGRSSKHMRFEWSGPDEATPLTQLVTAREAAGSPRPPAANATPRRTSRVPVRSRFHGRSAVKEAVALAMRPPSGSRSSAAAQCLRPSLRSIRALTST
jgi:Protein of unknown function (DUF1326)